MLLDGVLDGFDGEKCGYPEGEPEVAIGDRHSGCGESDMLRWKTMMMMMMLLLVVVVELCDDVGVVLDGGGG